MIKRRGKDKKKRKIANKSNPTLWEQAKTQAKARMGGKHSARSMQLATKIYKEKGGSYIGKKTKSNSLTKWTKQNWQASDGGNSYRKDKKGNKIVKKYLPEKAWNNLNKKEIVSLDNSKRKAEKKRKQFSKSPKKLTSKISDYWK
jgi:hypothetical protein